MLASILKLKGVKKLNKSNQKSTNGGIIAPPYRDGFECAYVYNFCHEQYHNRPFSEFDACMRRSGC